MLGCNFHGMIQINEIYIEMGYAYFLQGIPNRLNPYRRRNVGLKCQLFHEVLV